MELTKERVLELTVELWRWLERNPGKDKSEWPGWKLFPGIISLCFCCDYVDNLPGALCTACPLISLWPDGCETSERSPYRDWKAEHRDKDYPKAGAAARNIWEGARLELEKVREASRE